MTTPAVNMTPTDHADLVQAKLILESPGWVAKVTEVVGKPIEMGMAKLPDKTRSQIGKVVNAALTKALEGALLSMDKDAKTNKPYNGYHKLAAAVSGAVGGFFGAWTMVVELPFSTMTMMRSIADIARANGENLRDPESHLACIQVFGLGRSTPDDDDVLGGYYAARNAMAKAVTQALEYLAESEVAKEAPALISLINLIAKHFEIQVSNKAMFELIPVIGAVGGAGINLIFMDYYQDLARAHFTIRRLERVYGEDLVKLAYDQIELPHPRSTRVSQAA